MKLISLLFSLVFLTAISCKKDNKETRDYRNEVTGDYDGIQVETRWVDTIVGYKNDTSYIQITLSASSLDSMVDVTLIPAYSNGVYSYKYIGGGQFSQSNPRVENDSLILYIKDALGPIWANFYTKKTSP